MAGSFIAVFMMFIWIMFAVFIVASAKKNRSDIRNARAQSVMRERAVPQAYGGARAGVTPRVVNTQGSNDRGMILKDDINNDWLAMQRREEARAVARISDMFQLKLEHSAKCESEFIRRFHESNCDAEAIDSGIRK
ncbi:MAG: hypothetical protein K6F34_11350 [Lachnospiraceae bacterium]|nr:hypothetical protein [Lachnospiraceae bacterium]